jgi:hypothetical protein
LKNSIAGRGIGGSDTAGGAIGRAGGPAGLELARAIDLLGQRIRDFHGERHARSLEAVALTSTETRSARSTNTDPRAVSLAIRGIDWFIRTRRRARIAILT